MTYVRATHLNWEWVGGPTGIGDQPDLYFSTSVSISHCSPQVDPNADVNVLLLLEPKEIWNPSLEELARFDIVATLREDLPCSTYRIVPSYFPFELHDSVTKSKDVSFLASAKGMVPGHFRRREFFDRLPEQVGSVHIDKFFSPPYIYDKTIILDDYRFTIAMENQEDPGVWSEKLIHPILTETVPIYIGPDVSDYFDEDGIIRFSSYDELVKALESITPSTYNEMLPAVLRNKQKAQKYRRKSGDYIWERLDDIVEQHLIDRKAGH